jgi:hypothetical protein
LQRKLAHLRILQEKQPNEQFVRIAQNNADQLSEFVRKSLPIRLLANFGRLQWQWAKDGGKHGVNGFYALRSLEL